MLTRRAWSWLTGLVAGGGVFLLWLAVPGANFTRSRALGLLFLLGLVQGSAGRRTWLLAAPLGLAGTILLVIAYVGPMDTRAPLASLPKWIAYVAMVNGEGMVAALVGLLVRIGGERVRSFQASRQLDGHP